MIPTMSTITAAQDPPALAAAAAGDAAPADDRAPSGGQWKEALVPFLIQAATAAFGAILAGLGNSSVAGGWPGAVGSLLGAFRMGVVRGVTGYVEQQLELVGDTLEKPRSGLKDRHPHIPTDIHAIRED
ncbi:hypothetical protein DL767_000183 [Monosporascus sp. MG133]|nr:hypothetical protein DL767_000183 [Monosporascus sp. MG133]